MRRGEARRRRASPALVPALVIAVFALAVVACGGGSNRLAKASASSNPTRVWCTRFARVVTAFTALDRMIPEGVRAQDAIASDPKTRAAARKTGLAVKKLRETRPPGPIADDYKLVTTTLPPRLSGSSADEQKRYDAAIAELEDFITSRCHLDRKVLALLGQTD